MSLCSGSWVHWAPGTRSLVRDAALLCGFPYLGTGWVPSNLANQATLEDSISGKVTSFSEAESHAKPAGLGP